MSYLENLKIPFLTAVPFYYKCSCCGGVKVTIGVKEDVTDGIGLSKENPIEYVCELCEEW